MNNFKSLSDSSTSESEEDGKRLQQLLSCDGGIKREFSTDDTEDEQTDIFFPPKKIKTEFKNPAKYIEREISTDDTEDEQTELFSPKKVKNEFKNPAKYVERDLSDSESDDKSSTLSASFKLAANMPTKDDLSENYGIGMKLMQRMGYKSGAGLGKHEQGRVDIVHASKQRGRRGLGLILAGLEPSDTVWDSSKEEVLVKEPIEWIPECKSEPFEMSLLRTWVQEGKKKMTISEETEFCDPDILSKIITYKSVFDQLEPEEMRKARTRSNPFETIRGGIFLNRAAMKMANMDAAFDFMFTNPKTIDDLPAVAGNELLYFADVCAGPGGFSEYVLWRKKWHAKGFGFTLRGQNDFKLEDFFAGPPETFEPHYGAKDDGNIYDAANLKEFKKFVLENTDNKGVHFVMADGGFSVEGMENEQEILSKRLYLCQFLCALSILRIGGHFVCKLFDLFTPFSVGLVYLMYHAFEKVCIFKPNTSRPANSERYIICKWLKENTKDICDYMKEINDILQTCSESSCDRDVTDVVPLEVLKADEDFYEYIVNSNNTLGAMQIIHLDKIRVFTQNTELHDERQNDLKKQCLILWKVPDKARSAPKRPDAKEIQSKFTELMQGESLSAIRDPPKLLDINLLQKLKSVFEFQCVVSGEVEAEKATLIIGLGRSNVYQLDMKSNKWNKIKGNLELPANTLLFGEIVFELKGESRAQRKINCLHIIDAIYLGETNVRKKHFPERLQLAEKLAKAVSKPSKPDYMPLRVKKVFKFQNVEDVFDCLASKVIKNSSIPKLCFDLGDGRHILPTGLLIFRTIKDPWVIAYSKSRQKPYYFNTKKNESRFEIVEEACADFMTSYSSRILWKWEPGINLLAVKECDEAKNKIHSHTIKSFVRKSLNQIVGIHS